MRMKKLLSILLVTAMLASMAVTAFAEGEVTDIPAEQVPMTELAPDATAVTVEPAAATQENGSFSVRGGSDYQAAYEAAGITFENGTLTINKATFEAFAAKDSEQKTLMTRDGKLYVGLEFSVPSNNISQYQKFQLADTREVDLTKELDQQYGLDVYTDSGNNKHVVVYINVTKDANGTIRDPLTNKEFVGSWKGENNEVKVTSTYTLNVAIDETELSEASITPTLGDFTLENEAYKGKLTLTNSVDVAGSVKVTKAEVKDSNNNTAGTVTVAYDDKENKTINVPKSSESSGKKEVDVTVGFTGDPVAEATYTVTLTLEGATAATVTQDIVIPKGEDQGQPEGNVTPAKNVEFKLAEGEYTGTVTLTNSAAQESTVEVTGKVKNAKGDEVGTVVIAEAAPKASITVPGNNGTKNVTVTVTLNAPTAAGTYNVSLIIAGKETTVGTITVAKDPETDMPTISATLGATVEVGTPLSSGSVVLGKLEAATGYKLTAAVTKDGVAYNNLTINANGDQNNIAGAGYTFTTTEAGAKTISLADINFTEKGTYKIKFTVVKTDDAKVTATSEEKTVTVTKQIDESAVNAVLAVGEAENGVATGTLTLKNPTQESVDLIPNVTVSAGATIEIAEDAGWKNNEAVTLDGTTVTEKVLTFKVKCPTDKAGAVTYTVNATVTKDAAPIEGMPDTATVTIPGNGGTVDPTPNPGDNGSNNSGSSSSGSSSSTPANAPSANVGAGGAVSAAKISGDAKKAVSNAKNGKANVNVTNAKTVGTAALNNMAKAAAKEDVALTMTAKTTDKNGVVVASLKFDATKAAEAVAKAGTKEVKLGVELNTKNTKNVTSLFKKWFKNKNMTAVKMAQKGEFGFTVEAAVKVDLKNFNKNNLKFYSYDAATNTYKEIETKYTIDAKGLVHFNTTVGNYIIITDAPIASK